METHVCAQCQTPWTRIEDALECRRLDLLCVQSAVRSQRKAQVKK